nr:hypothetical protein [uncultured Propionivibrio sp.]
MLCRIEQAHLMAADGVLEREIIRRLLTPAMMDLIPARPCLFVFLAHVRHRRRLLSDHSPCPACIGQVLRLAMMIAAASVARFAVRIAVLGLLAACASPLDFGGTRESVRAWAEARGFRESILTAGSFELTAFLRRAASVEGGGIEAGEAVLTVYIEGDGAAWSSPYHPPRDPTPRRPLALALAAIDPSPAVAYLGRPCQYLDAAALARCSSAYWVDKRFDPEVIEAYDQAISGLKARFSARSLRLVGYSGGGNIAAVLAMRRADVLSLIALASPLSLAAWVERHGLTPLPGAIDPGHEPGQLRAASYWVGSNDDIVPPAVVQPFAERKGGAMHVVKDYDHECCWSADWLTILRESP